jgi:D-threo-aldose 1-dehydrogenase
VSEAFRALDELRARGVIGAVSLGINHADVAAAFIRAAPAPGPDCVLLAGRFTVLDRSAADDLLPLCHDRGIAVIGAGVFQGGILTGSPGTSAGALGPRIDAVRSLLRQYDVPLAAAAIQFPFRHPAVPAVLVGARTPAEIEQSAAMLAHDLPDAFWATLDALDR